MVCADRDVCKRLLFAPGELRHMDVGEGSRVGKQASLGIVGRRFYFYVENKGMRNHGMGVFFF